jgi:outer membrane biosynthesis protein TonB
VRNVAVDETEQVLRDDRHNNPSDIYDEARRVQASLDASRKALQQQQGGDEVLRPAGSEAAASSEGTAETYKGPSVLSYNLDGRKAMRLPIPVYQCRGGGDVTVRIEVDRGGYVVNTAIDTAVSTSNDCLIEAAKRAAKTSRFAANSKAPARQQGHIVYRFIAQ